ncbi:hypothetical protein AUF78_16950 [archaeon 13_1_20CM_2_51_12]|nr:MAG: hypothetical protein AUI97_09105 [Crenarchaeota archaeon 13_1_40CM_3_52_17]OLE68266.1 MAG: hypothetical protein AUF78_16950 [archaeon 13_1_20CM_2_51_12]
MGQQRTESSMTNGVNGAKRKRRPAQKGVQAVFTSEASWKVRAQLALGLIAIGVGTGAWSYSARGFVGLGLGNLIPWDASVSAFLLPVSIPLLIGGVGLCTYYLAMRRTWQTSSRIESALYELEALMEKKNSPDSDVKAGIVREAKLMGRRSFHLPKVLAIALVEAIVMIIIYSGLVREYGSNVEMQDWVQANFAPGGYLLNYYGVLIVAGLLGVAIFQLIPRRLQSNRFQG